jgi:hypothetical protein
VLQKLQGESKRMFMEWQTAAKFLAALEFLMKGKSVKDCCNLTSGAFAQGTHIDFGAD